MLSTTILLAIASDQVKAVNSNMLDHELLRCFALYCRVFESSFCEGFRFLSLSGFPGNKQRSSLNARLI